MDRWATKGNGKLTFSTASVSSSVKSYLFDRKGTEALN